MEEQTFELCTSLDPVPKYCLQDSGTLAIHLNWILRAEGHRGFPHFTGIEKEAKELIQVHLNKIGTKLLQVSLFSR